MGIYETRRELIQDSDGPWWISNGTYSTIVTVENEIIVKMAPIKNKWLGRNFKAFVAKESYGRKNFKARRLE